ncbi:MAG: hypothetical protein AAF351_15025 [Pseudomonadota bacterium]
MRKIFYPLAALFLVGGVAAQGLEEIVVTGTRISDSYYDAPSMPAVTLAKEADFLIQNIRLVNDSRAPNLRREEIITTIENLLRRAKSMQGMALSYGTGFLEPVDLDEVAVQMLEDRQRIDTSYINVVAKIEFDPKRDPKKQIEDLREFVDGTKKAGRTEILRQGDIGLSIVGPEQYRYEIIKKIGAENTRVLEAIGSNCDVSVGSLENRVQWQRTGIGELTLYIDYYLQIDDCSQATGS